MKQSKDSPGATVMAVRTLQPCGEAPTFGRKNGTVWAVEEKKHPSKHRSDIYLGDKQRHLDPVRCI